MYLLVGFVDFRLQVVSLLVDHVNLAVDLPAQLLDTNVTKILVSERSFRNGAEGPHLQLLHAPGHGRGRTALGHVPRPLLHPLLLLLLQQTFGDGQHQTLPEDRNTTSHAEQQVCLRVDLHTHLQVMLATGRHLLPEGFERR